MKGEPLKGWSNYNINGITGRIDAANSTVVPALFGRLVAKVLRRPEETCLVPVPDSSRSTAANRFSKTSVLAEAVVQNVGGVTVWNGLRWSQVIPRASQTNNRDPDFYYQKLRMISPIPKGLRMILVDDVSTSGAHFKAVRARLREQGFDPNWAICFARTVHDQSLPALGALSEEMEEWTP